MPVKGEGNVGKHDDSVAVMWNSYFDSLGGAPARCDSSYSSWQFGDTKLDANELVQLVIKGVKRATASLYEVYSYEGIPLPEPGDYSVVTDGEGVARCIIQTQTVEIIPYRDVSEEFAAQEGEGDRSLGYWKRVQWAFFSREMEAMGKKPSQEMLVVCETFSLVYMEK